MPTWQCLPYYFRVTAYCSPYVKLLNITDFSNGLPMTALLFSKIRRLIKPNPGSVMSDDSALRISKMILSRSRLRDASFSDWNSALSSSRTVPKISKETRTVVFAAAWWTLMSNLPTSTSDQFLVALFLSFVLIAVDNFGC